MNDLATFILTLAVGASVATGVLLLLRRRVVRLLEGL